MDKHTTSLEVLAAKSWWIKSKREQGVTPNPKVSELMPTMYKTLDSIYLEPRRLPFGTISGAFRKGDPMTNPMPSIFGLWLKNRDYLAWNVYMLVAGRVHSNTITTTAHIQSENNFDIYTTSDISTSVSLSMDLGSWWRYSHGSENKPVPSGIYLICLG